MFHVLFSTNILNQFLLFCWFCGFLLPCHLLPFSIYFIFFSAEFLWQEGHTAHATAEDAVSTSREILDMYASVCEVRTRNYHHLLFFVLGSIVIIIVIITFYLFFILNVGYIILDTIKTIFSSSLFMHFIDSSHFYFFYTVS